MDSSELDVLLRDSAPRGLSSDKSLASKAVGAVASTRAQAPLVMRNRQRRRLVIGIPVAVFGAIALTAGAVVVHDLMPVITTIPIVYTTDTGKTITCHASIDGGGGAATTREIAKFVNSKDWAGVGQKVYDYALAHPWKPNPKDSWQDASGIEHQGDPPMTSAERDERSWEQAMWVYVPGPLPKNLHSPSWGWGSPDCTGVLH